MSDPDIAPPALRRQLRLIVPVALANTVANGMLWPVLPQIVLAELDTRPRNRQVIVQILGE